MVQRTQTTIFGLSFVYFNQLKVVWQALSTRASCKVFKVHILEGVKFSDNVIIDISQ